MLYKTCKPNNLFNNNRIEVMNIGVNVDSIKDKLKWKFPTQTQ